MLLANVMLFGWPLICLILFARFEFRLALILSIVGAFLFLPAHFSRDFPLIPPVDKALVGGLGAFLGAVVFAAKVNPSTVLPGWFPKSNIIRILILMLLVGAVVTALANSGRLVYAGGLRVQKGLSFYDGFTQSISYVVLLLPFLIGRRYLNTSESHRVLVVALAVLAMIYSLPTLFEVRMSPQIQKLVYGFHGGNWRQNLRAGGFRPYVFLNHGLMLSIFLFAGFAATLGCIRFLKGSQRSLAFGAAVWLFLTLILSKSLGALVLGIGLGLMVLLFKARLQLTIAAIICAMFMVWPLLRSNDIIPTDQLVELAGSASEDRAGSLKYRFDNEDILLDRALKKPITGWGHWGRNRVINEKGQDVSTTDGGWIITLGEGGFLRYIGLFGLITVPIMLMAIRRYPIELSTAAAIMIATGSLVNVLPNSTISPVVWLVVGAIAGRYERGKVEEAETDSADEPVPEDRQKRRSRQWPKGAIATDRPIYTRQTKRHQRIRPSEA